MSKILIECDRCGTRVVLPLRQAHQARDHLKPQGWTTKDVSSRFGACKEDYCPACR